MFAFVFEPYFSAGYLINLVVQVNLLTPSKINLFKFFLNEREVWHNLQFKVACLFFIC
jgi:hypothetical protein